MRRVAVALCLVGCASEQGLSREVIAPIVGNPDSVETPFNEDRVVQVTIPKTDILFVVDNSCSMAEEQELLATNFPVFLEWFQGSGLDYHIGVVSTDMNDPLHTGRLRAINGQRWIQDSTESPDAIFGAMAEMGTGGHWVERGRAAAYTAVELLAASDNHGFIREDAGLHLTVVSDEDDESEGSPVSRDEFVDYLVNARPTRQMVSFSAIVGPAFGCETALEPGSDYLAVSAALGGVQWSICEPEWDGVLDRLGFVAVGLKSEFFLSQIPVPGTIEVTTDVDGVVQSFDEGVDWEYQDSRNSIEFLEYMPQPREQIRIRYRLASALQDDLAGDVPDVDL